MPARVPAAVCPNTNAGTAAHNILLALHARGFGGIWRTGPAAYDPYVKQALGLDPRDALIGFLYVGTARPPLPRVDRPGPERFLEEWKGPAT